MSVPFFSQPMLLLTKSLSRLLRRRLPEKPMVS
jgi:hypothetical protein